MARSLEVIGEWWTLLILRDVFVGITKFDQLQARLGIARNVLAKRLDTLVQHGVLERRSYDEARKRHEYVLTDRGRALWPVLAMIRQWGEEWLVDREDAAATMVHSACGQSTKGFLTCEHCHQELRFLDLRVPAGGRHNGAATNPPASSARSAAGADRHWTASPSPEPMEARQHRQASGPTCDGGDLAGEPTREA